MKKIFFLFGLLLFLISCDPGSHFYNKVENHSSRQIVLIHKLFSSGEVILNPGESVKADGGQMGSYHYLKEDYFKGESYCPCFSDSIFIYPSDTSLTITKDIQNENSWESHDRRKKISSGGEFYCTFTVTDADIQ